MSMNMDSQIFLYAQRWILYPGCQRLSRGHNTRLLCFFCRPLADKSSRQACRERASGTKGMDSAIWVVTIDIKNISVGN